MNTYSEEYQSHNIFLELGIYQEFYKSLSYNVMNFVSLGTSQVMNIDTYVFSSMEGTIDSILLLLRKGRLNDAYSLLRKYFDSVIINVYVNLFLQDNQHLGNFIVQKIENWLKAVEKIPEYRLMSEYIRKSEKLKDLSGLVNKDERYKKLRTRCNDNTHYNYYYNIVLNDNEVYLPFRIKTLAQFSLDIADVFVLHFAYIFWLNPHYMASSDYVDHLDCGNTPPEGSENWVAPFVQSVFDSVVKKKRQDVAQFILDRTGMLLN